MNESKFIPGIHNYCDRWCERCYFTSRCRVYEKLDESDTEANDINNKQFGINYLRVWLMLRA